MQEPEIKLGADAILAHDGFVSCAACGHNPGVEAVLAHCFRTHAAYHCPCGREGHMIISVSRSDAVVI